MTARSDTCIRGHEKVVLPSGSVCRECDARRKRERRADPAFRDVERARDRDRKRRAAGEATS